ncbi:DUF3887 domain-containing protein [Corynebacterium amycolatum]|uniref:DUF3887 domain-containing protein n=1 Tax=Corynebacterium amycolatum TaxID=43765 RepID=UPI00065F9E51|nr:hypothetical protein [Corynebacterium amycolatum]MCQ9173120.1 hypothetical protein [Corynebacterium amycolatum]OMQ07672.1 hypothetical protein BXT90_06940 [Corynebacterium amycolatum]
MDPLTTIRHRLQATNIAEQELEDAVAQARTAGHSWAEIGNVLNISRQAAFKRFGSVQNPVSGELMTATKTTHIAELGEKFLRHIINGEEAETVSMISPKLRKDLPWSTIYSVWEDVLTETGAFESFDDTQVTSLGGTRTKEPTSQKLLSKILGTSLVITTLKHEAGEWMARVAFDRHENVIGLLILPVDATEFPF